VSGPHVSVFLHALVLVFLNNLKRTTPLRTRAAAATPQWLPAQTW
jgi:hypothetical protein